MATISVGSNVFFAVALLAIGLLVLLLLRHFLPLRATPGYLLLPVFLALALPASVILLVPIDLGSDEGPTAIWLPDRLLLVSWRITYWLIFVLTWFILPLLGDFIDSGYREPRARIQYSLRSNARYQLTVLVCAVGGLVYISVQNGFEFTSLKALVMALAYVWGLVLAIYLMGHGLVAIPRKLFRTANPSGRLRRLQTHAPRVHDRLIDAVNDLQVLEAQVKQLHRRKTGTARDFQEWIDDLAEACGPPDPRATLAQASEPAPIPAVITERYLADLTRRLQRTRHQKARFLDEWDRLVQSAADVQAIINSSASKKLEFPRVTTQLGPLRPRFTLLTPYMRYGLHVHLLPGFKLVLGALLAAASVCIIWSEVIKSVFPNLSIVSITVISSSSSSSSSSSLSINFGGQVVASAWLLYMCAAALAGVTDAKVWGNRALVPRNTYGESACWYAGQVARLTVPTAYNFLTFLPRDVRENTIFYNFLGRLIDLTPLGKGFDYFFPIFILLPVLATLFNLYGRVKNIFGFGLIEEDEDEYLENNPAGYGLGGWREGRELIDRELNGLGSLALASRSVGGGGGGGGSGDARVAIGAASGSASGLAPPPLGSRASRPPRRPPASTMTTTVEPLNDGEEENFFQSFAHRVRNTFDTAKKPQWMQAEPFRLPRWMRDTDDDERSPAGGLAQIFGGRPAEGRVRL
ncbi:hypothetical protein ASPZODRAFT_131131 [Penicilliopsis zonata CBS 506.65]|uniref:Uncharacterized protein n=1 Tax=Penicilliopsis zonata CBS 506.65 TaxID=1073090 RepID=A0A1L9SK98_9EURO|nr:hypothetical protein ASPZODRAFT_131131 [Penicilliopsis zonata CBS 506.65]OJJ47595.1 hypothetical protein ASPZODRAFT_131131 [Penicilliopsis zonata CBS 506.65]